MAASGLLAYLIPRGDSLIGRFLSLRPLVYLGTISYTLYLVHAFVLVYAHRDGLEGVTLAAVAFAVTVAAASISWFALERPLQRLKSVVAPYPNKPTTEATQARVGRDRVKA